MPTAESSTPLPGARSSRPASATGPVPGAAGARHITLLYLVIACAWIYFSDALLAWLLPERAEFVIASQLKGVVFVALTAALLYLALRRSHVELASLVHAARESEERYRAVFEASPRPIIVYDERTLAVLAVNAAACHLYGYEEPAFLRLTVRDIRPPEDVPILLEELVSPKFDPSRRWRHRRSDGTVMIVEVAGARTRFAGRLARLAFVTDVTARVREEEHMNASALAFENVAEAVAVLDRRGRIVTVNRAFERLTHFPEDEVLGRSARMLVHGSPRLLRQALMSTAKIDGEVWLKRREAKPFLVELSVRSVRDVDGSITHYVAVARDMSAEKEAEARIHALAYYDTLTRLPNRNLLEDRARQVIALHERTGDKFALMMADLDNFKQVNDTLGHMAGDSLLQIAARHVDAAVREADTAARWGGDEFVLLMPTTDQDGAARIAQRVLKAMAAPATIDGKLVALGASIGISVYPKDGRDFESLLKNAGSAMQRAKDMGRNTFQFYEEPAHGEAQERVAIAGALRHALDGGAQMQVYYQPQLDLATGRIAGFEALVRWRHPELGQVAPDKFIRIAETNGYMTALGSWVLDQACAQLRALTAAGYGDAKMGVNVSVVQLHDPRFAERCLEIMQDAGVEPRRLELEVTESVLLQDRESVLEQFARLREKGVGISIDDFGTGFSSLSYLRQLPVNKIKIDKSFVHDMLDDADAASIVEVIVSLAHTLRHEVVAEGVETPEQQRALAALRCDHAQGFLFGRPMPPTVLYDWLRDHRSRTSLH